MLPTVARSQIDIVPVTYFDNPYLGPEETMIVTTLIGSVKPRVVIEIGCQNGLTARCILANTPSIETYIGVDVPANHQPTLPDQRSQVPRQAGFKAANDPRFFTLIRKRGSLELMPADIEPCDAVFIDGDHSVAAVRRDAMLARALTRPGGIIIFHDYMNPSAQVTEALDRLHDKGWPLVHIEGTWLAFVRIPKTSPPGIFAG